MTNYLILDEKDTFSKLALELMKNQNAKLNVNYSKTKINYHFKKHNIKQNNKPNIEYYDNSTTQNLINEIGLKEFTNKVMTKQRFNKINTIIQLDPKSDEKIIEHLSKHLDSIHKI